MHITKLLQRHLYDAHQHRRHRKKAFASCKAYDFGQTQNEENIQTDIPN